MKHWECLRVFNCCEETPWPHTATFTKKTFNCVSETSFNKNTTCQGRGTGIRKLVKNTKMQVKIVKQKHRIISGRRFRKTFQWTLKSLAFNFPYTFIPQYKRGKKATKDFNMIQRTTWTVNCYIVTTLWAIKSLIHLLAFCC